MKRFATETAPNPALPSLALIDQLCVDELAGRYVGAEDFSRLAWQDGRAVIEATQRFLPPGVSRRYISGERQTELSSADIGRRINEKPQEPPLPYMLLAADRFTRREKTVAERRVAGAAGAVSTMLGVVEFGSAVLSNVTPTRPLKGLVQAPAVVAAVGREGLAVFGRRGEAELHRAVSRAVYRRHGVRHIDNPDAKKDDHSLAAWMLAWSLERICHDGAVRRGCEPLAEALALRLRFLKSSGIIVAAEAGTNPKKGVRPAGIELIDLCDWLENGTPVGEAVAGFSAMTQKRQTERQKTAAHYARPRRPSSAPDEEMIRALEPGVMQYHEDSLLAPAELQGQIERTEEQLKSRGWGFLSHEALARFALITKERQDAAAIAYEQARSLGSWQEMREAGNEWHQFDTLYRELLTHGEQLDEFILSFASYIGKGEEPVGTMMYAYDRLFGYAPLRDSRRPRLENALARVANRWYRQQPLEKVLQTTYMEGVRPEVYETKIPFSQTTGLSRQAQKLMIRTFLYDAMHSIVVPVLREDQTGLSTRLQQVRRDMLMVDVPRRRRDRDRLFLHLPPVASLLLTWLADKKVL